MGGAEPAHHRGPGASCMDMAIHLTDEFTLREFRRLLAPMTIGTRARQLARFVVYEAALPMIADSPAVYDADPKGLEFLVQGRPGRGMGAERRQYGSGRAEIPLPRRLLQAHADQEAGLSRLPGQTHSG